MKNIMSLFESLLDINVNNDDIPASFRMNVREFRLKYAKETSPIILNPPVPINIGTKYMDGICKNFKTNYLDIYNLQIDEKHIISAEKFSANCKKMIYFRGPAVSNINCVSIDNYNNFFQGCTQLKDIMFNCFSGTKNIISTENMFDGCKSLKEIDLGDLDLKTLKYANYMFANCDKLEKIILYSSDILSLSQVWGIFANCKKLRIVSAPNIIFDLSTPRIDWGYLFIGNPNLEILNLKYINVENMSGLIFNELFKNTRKLKTIRIKGFGNFRMRDSINIIKMDWATELDMESWDFLFRNMHPNDTYQIMLPDIPELKEKLIKKYDSVIKKYGLELI